MIMACQRHETAAPMPPTATLPAPLPTARPTTPPFLELPSYAYEALPYLLSQTGAFTDTKTLTPAPSLLPYAVNSPLWTDGALKKRWIVVPHLPESQAEDRPAISFTPTGEWYFPSGTVLVKQFDLATDERDPSKVRRLETRFIVRSNDGQVYGATYRWRDDQTDAELLYDGRDDDITVTKHDGSTQVQRWHYPSRTECLSCHNRIAGGIHLAGGNIIDARIHTTRDGLAVDNFLVQDPLGRPFAEDNQIARLRTAIADSLANRHRLVDKLFAKPLARTRAEAFTIEPSALIDNKASNRFTVIEVNAQDRPALLNQLAYALFQSKVTLHSAHIATYGERAVDTFYVTDLLGGKIEGKARLKTLEKRLLEAASGEMVRAAA